MGAEAGHAWQAHLAAVQQQRRHACLEQRWDGGRFTRRRRRHVILVVRDTRG